VLVSYIAMPLSLLPWGEKIVALVRQLDAPLSYVAYVVAQWTTFGLAWFGLLLKHVNIRNLINYKMSLRSWFNEIPAVILFLTVAVGGTTFLYLLFGDLYRTQSLSLPGTPLQLLAFVPLAVTAGICEEFVFRGYFLSQLSSAPTGFAGALIVQAALFGLAHGYHQTIVGFLQKFLLGLAFGTLVRWRKSLIPAILAHVLLDLSGGILSTIFARSAPR
jgi:membrane protease YdiL (CAAX protease family)